MNSTDEDHLGRQVSSEHRTSSWDHKQQALVYDPSMDTLETEECGGECRHLARKLLLSCIAHCDSYPVHLPWWSNKVDIYLDPKNRSGFIATVRLDRLGPAKVWQRRLRHNYTVLHVKGLKPEKDFGTSARSSASIPVVQNGQHSR